MNIMFDSIIINYTVRGEKFTCNDLHCEHFDLIVQSDGDKLSISIVPKLSLSIDLFRLTIPYTYDDSNRIFVNGYQSWTDSMEYHINQQMSELARSTEFLLRHTPLKMSGIGRSGDLFFHDYPRRRGVFYGWSYGYVRRGDNVDLFASLSERSGFTIVGFDVSKGFVFIEKDLEGVCFDVESQLLSMARITDEYDAAFDRWFEYMNIRCRETKKRNGYTTWYNYYSRINESVVDRDLQSLASFDAHIDCFQIDDGYQTAVGDWLSVDHSKFPGGMAEIARKIHSKGLLAGLWLAPFAVVPSSEVYKAYPDWLIRDARGKKYKTGHNWGGFYSLDIYNTAVRDHLKHVFDVVLNEWGYDLVKLDFLYGACVLPMRNKTRGEIMCDAMDLIRECCGDKLVLGCGVPLMPAFGKVDYCRIGADIALSWRHDKRKPREDVSTPHAALNTMFRRALNGRAWMNDPDVFLLRKNNIQMDVEQRELTALVNSVFGSLLFVSDNVAEYDDRQADMLKRAFAPTKIRVLSVDLDHSGVVIARYLQDGESKVIVFNCRNGRRVK